MIYQETELIMNDDVALIEVRFKIFDAVNFAKPWFIFD